MDDEPYIAFDAVAEEGLAGAIMGSNGDALDSATGITAELFWTSGPAAVFAAAVALRLLAAPVNVHTVTTWLRDNGKLEAAGNAVAISAMNNFLPPEMVEYWTQRLQDQLALRRLQRSAAWTLAQIRPGAEASEILAEARSQMATVEPAADVCDSHELPRVIAESLEALDRMDRGEHEPCLKTGIQAWDNLFGGLMPGQYYGLGGRPGLGKSALMEQIIFKMVALDDIPVLLFEKDMGLRMLLDRMACREAKVPYWRFIRRLTTLADRDKIRVILQGIGESKLRLHNPHNLTAEKMCAIVRREQRQFGVQAVFLDHIQLLDVGRDLREGLTRASITLSRHIPESNIPHVALFHVNRTGAKGRPSGEDVKEFDQLLGDVDGLAMLWSDKKREDLKEGEDLRVNIFAAKNRNGSTVEETMVFDGPLMKFK